MLKQVTILLHNYMWGDLNRTSCGPHYWLTTSFSSTNRPQVLFERIFLLRASLKMKASHGQESGECHICGTSGVFVGPVLSGLHNPGSARFLKHRPSDPSLTWAITSRRGPIQPQWFEAWTIHLVNWDEPGQSFHHLFGLIILIQIRWGRAGPRAFYQLIQAWPEY